VRSSAPGEAVAVRPCQIPDSLSTSGTEEILRHLDGLGSLWWDRGLLYWRELALDVDAAQWR
jgi:hypothetical protein